MLCFRTKLFIMPWYPKISFGVFVAALCIGPTLFLNVLKDPPAVQEARMAKWAKREKEIREQQERQLEAYADKVIEEEEKNAPIYEQPRGHLKEAIGRAPNPTAWEKLREENQRK